MFAMLPPFTGLPVGGRANGFQARKRGRRRVDLWQARESLPRPREAAGRTNVRVQRPSCRQRPGPPV